MAHCCVACSRAMERRRSDAYASKAAGESNLPGADIQRSVLPIVSQSPAPKAWRRCLDALEHRHDTATVQMLRALLHRVDSARNVVHDQQRGALHAVDGAENGSSSSSASRVNDVERRNRHFWSGRTWLPDRSMSRCDHCRQCRLLVAAHLPGAAAQPSSTLSHVGLRAVAEWLENEAETLRRTDPQQYDDVIAAYAWCAREAMDAPVAASRRNGG